MPSTDNEASRVVFLPRLRGTLPCARCPRGALAYSGVRPMLEPLSSTKTSRSASSGFTCYRSAHSVFLAAFTGCQRFFFRVQPMRLMARLMVAVLTRTPCVCSHSRQ
jgi:hypothetical protein